MTTDIFLLHSPKRSVGRQVEWGPAAVRQPHVITIYMRHAGALVSAECLGSRPDRRTLVRSESWSENQQ